MKPRRIFLGWDAPAIPAIARWLADRASRDLLLDLSHLLVVLPGRRAGRQLLRALTDLATRDGLALSPPRVVTPGLIVSELFDLPPAATPPAMRLAWASALQHMPHTTLQPLIPKPPDDPEGWLTVADLLARAHDELAGECLTFADVADAIADRNLMEEDRWRAAAAVQDAYARTLAHWHLQDPGLAAIDAVRTRAPARTEVILAGLVELGALPRRALATLPVTALIIAPESERDAFDDLGCILPDAWAARRIDIDASSIIFADDPADEAEHALAAIASLNEDFAADEVTISVPDDAAESVAAAAEDAGIPVHVAAGIPIERTAPLRLLHAVSELLATRSFAAGAELARHHDFAASLDPSSDAWPELLDDYQQAALPVWFTSPADATSSPEARRAARVVRAILDALGPLWETENKPLSAWADPIASLLARVYGRWSADARDPDGMRVAGACTAIAEALDDLRALPAECTGTSLQAIRLILDTLTTRTIPADPDDDAIEIVGWLELALDPAPVAILCRMNEGTIPATGRIDPLIPQPLRRALGIRTADSTLARDAYLLSSILASRRHVRLLACRASAEGDPLWPSRLLFACDDADIPTRLKRFQHPSHERLRVRPARAGQHNLFQPPPVHPVPIDAMSVTAFRTYLSSPRRFYLEHILKLSEVADEAHEMDPMSFGSLIHSVLESLARSDARDADDPDRVNQAVQDILSTLTLDRFGPRPSMAVRIQIEFARRRLAAFANLHANRVRNGWRIWQEPEWRPQKQPFLDVDGQPMFLRGKIDRIDRHESGAVAIIDYKTGDQKNDPVRAHKAGNRWVDLQLPLYRHLAAELDLPDQLHLAYIILPRDTGKAALLTADWTPDELLDADEAAREVVRSIRRGEFDLLGDEEDDGGSIARLMGLGVRDDGGST